MLDELISQSEARGHIVSTEFYNALIRNEQENIRQLEEEKAALIEALQLALASGTIEKGSEAWYEMINKINDVTLAIEQGRTAIIDYGNAIREIEWEVFDLLQDQISDVTKEADFLIELLSSDKLYDDKGQLTDEGMSTMGLHGMNYNVHMIQADKYAQELLKINRQLAQDPYNKELIKRKQELLELQRESILAAEDEKQAIVDMVKEGIEIELSALQELIDTYKEALDSQKDLYDYQKKIQDQIENISSLEKQMSAYENDTSEETKSKIQQIKVELEEAREDLEETQYDKYISDQKQLLDELYVEYELILNQRLDNIDALIEDMISEINSNASVINSTLTTKADEVGYTLSETMRSTWSTSTGDITSVLSMYGSGVQTSVQNAISKLETESEAMKSALNANALNEINAITTSGDDIEKKIEEEKEKVDDNTERIINALISHGDGIKDGIKAEGAKLDPNTDRIISAITSHGEGIKTSIGNAVTTLSSALSSIGSNISSLGSRVNSLASSVYSSNAQATSTGVSSSSNKTSPNNNNNNSTKNNATFTAVAYDDPNYIYGAPALPASKKKNGHRDGVYKLPKDEIAWTQEGRKMEAIIRPSDGAILTPLAKDDSVLKSSATANIFNFANDPSGFIRDNLNIVNSVSGVPYQKQIGGNYDNDFDIHIELPNVTNYEEFKYAMQHDKGFEKMVRAMTVDKMFGGSSLKKYKY